MFWLWPLTHAYSMYSRTSIIQTPLCQLHHKSVQISEFVCINEAHSLICDPLSKNPHSLHNFQFFLFSKHYLQCLRSGYSKFQLNQASSFEVIALDSRASKKIDLYSNHTENKLQVLTFAAIT